MTQGLISVWLMNGTTAVEGRLLTPGNVADTDWRIVGSGDFNRDGYADLVWQHRVSGQASVWFMNGTTRISVLLTPAVVDTNWQILAVTDLDSDGQPDLVWQNVSTGYLAAWLMNGDKSSRNLPVSISGGGHRMARGRSALTARAISLALACVAARRGRRPADRRPTVCHRSQFSDGVRRRSDRPQSALRRREERTHSHTVDGVVQPTPFLDLTGAIANGPERGLLELAIDRLRDEPPLLCVLHAGRRFGHAMRSLPTGRGL